jgi:adenosylhomocysteine nucleosidase
MNMLNISITPARGQKLLFLMAAEVEYGPELQKRFTPLITGIGPVEAAITTARALAQCHADAAMPDLIVCVGSSGSKILEQLGVYQASHVSYRDMDVTRLGFDKGETPLVPDSKILPLVCPLESYPQARLATGASIVSGDEYDSIDADMVDMEVFAIARACKQFGVPLMALRGISDGREDVRQLTDWTQYLHIIDKRLAEAVDILL